MPDPQHFMDEMVFITNVTCTCGATYKITTERGADRVRKTEHSNDH